MEKIHVHYSSPISWNGKGSYLGLLDNGQVVEWGDAMHNKLMGEPDLPPGHYKQVGGKVLPPGRHFIAISAGYNHSLGLLDNGQVVGWGWTLDHDKYGQISGAVLALPQGRHYIAISAGYEYSLGLLDNGQVVGWGNNHCGKATGANKVLPKGRHYIAISAGYDHSLGILDNGKVVGWGDRCPEVSIVNRSNHPFIAISAGNKLSMGLLADGHVVLWYDTPSFANMNRFNNKRYIAINAVDSIAYGLMANGDITIWDPYAGDKPDNIFLTGRWKPDNFQNISLKAFPSKKYNFASGYYMVPNTKNFLIERRASLFGESSNMQKFALTIIMQPESRWLKPQTKKYFKQCPKIIFEKVLEDIVSPHKKLRNQEWRVICCQTGEEYRKAQLIEIIWTMDLGQNIKSTWTKRKIYYFMKKFMKILKY